MPANLQNNPWFQLVLVLALAGAIVYFGWNIYPNTVEMEGNITSLQDGNTKLRKEVDEGHELEAKLPELEREIKSKELELQSLKRIIPSEREAEDLIRKVERMATENNIVVRSLTSQGTITREFYLEWPILITTHGTYHNLGKFFSKISQYARIINIQNVTLTANRTSNPNHTIDASFTALTYVYKEK